MPSFADSLSEQEIADVAAYVSESTPADAPAGFPRDVAAIACDLDRTLTWQDVCAAAPDDRGALEPPAPPASTSSSRPAACSGRRARTPCGRDRRAARLLPGRRRRRPPRANFSSTSPSRSSSRREAIAARRGEGFPLSCYVDDELYVAATPRRPPYADFPASRCTRSATLGWLERPPTKLVVVDDPIASIGSSRARGAFGGRLYIAKSLPDFLELATPPSTKGRGLAFLAEHVGFTPEETVAFGDGENDLELLEWAGYGVAVANAHEAVLALADCVCPSVEEEGVARSSRPPRLAS